MANLFRIFLMLALVVPVASCGVKGKLKTPEQIQKIEAKKAAEAQKKTEDESEENMGNPADGSDSQETQ